MLEFNLSGIVFKSFVVMTDQAPARVEELLGSHHQDFNELRRHCLLCHGLDRSADTLFTRSSYQSPSIQTQRVFKNVMSGGLLSLAICLRVNFYQGLLDPTVMLSMKYVSLYDDLDLVVKPVSIKDVVDKIIHADSVSKEAFPRFWEGQPKMMTQFKGKHRNRRWTLDMSVEHFAEAVLTIIDEADEKLAIGEA